MGTCIFKVWCEGGTCVTLIGDKENAAFAKTIKKVPAMYKKMLLVAFPFCLLITDRDF